MEFRFSEVFTSAPKLFLVGFESGVVPFTFSPQGIDRPKVHEIPLDGKPVVIRNGICLFGVFCCSGTFAETFTHIRTVVQMRCAPVRTAVFLSSSPIICEFFISVHSKSVFVKGTSHGSFAVFWFCICWRNHAITMGKIVYGVIDFFTSQVLPTMKVYSSMDRYWLVPLQTTFVKPIKPCSTISFCILTKAIN